MAVRVVATALTAYANALPYVPDYYLRAGNKVPSERFSLVRETGGGDCEDLTEEIMHQAGTFFGPSWS